MRHPSFLFLGPALLTAALMWAALPALAQQQQAPPAQAQSAPPQAAPTQEPDSAAEAARKSKAEKDKPKVHKVYTEEDLASLKGAVSVVGEDNTKTESADEKNPGANPPAGDEAKSGKKDEAYWRGRYQKLHDKVDELDKRIADLREEIRKYGKGGSSADQGGAGTQGPGQNVCGIQSGNTCQFILNDREGQVKDLEKQKAELQNQIDQLQDEARKAGVDSGWVR